MVVHLQKLSVGSESIQSLQDWQTHYIGVRVKKGLPPFHEHVTRMTPKRREDILAGGSIYWVIKGLIQCRNRIVGLEETRTQDGRKACSILMDPELIPVLPTPKRPFQGWRYLMPEDAPADITDVSHHEALPAHLRNKLVNLGAW